jgi:hypothetical protein
MRRYQRFSLAAAAVITVLELPLAEADSRPQPQPVTSARTVGTVHAGVDGDWVLEPANGLSYPQQARDRYECDLWAVDQSGFDPAQDNGGVPPNAVAGKRAGYLRAEVFCFRVRGYIVR